MEERKLTPTTAEEQEERSITPEDLGVTPRYALERNEITRGAPMVESEVKGMSATARKLAAMAMSLLPKDLSTRTAAFSFADFCKATGCSRGGESYKIFKDAVSECMRCVISVEVEDQDGKKKWVKFIWFSVAEFDEKTEQAKMTFSTDLARFLVSLRYLYCKINLKDVGNLQSGYAIQLFNMAKSYESLKGKGGNGTGKWYFERGFPDELRLIMGVPKDAYKDNHLLKQKVIDNPVKEINNAGIGLTVKPETIKKGNRIVSVRFNCEVEERKVLAKRGQKKAAGKLPDEAGERTREDKELAHLKEQHLEEFAELFAAEMANMPAAIKAVKDGGAMLAEGCALIKLKKKYGVQK